MWKHMARIIGEVLPQYVYVENSPMLVGRGLAVVLADLAEMGYDAKWGIVGAHHAGAPHKRDRIWIVANAAGAQDHAERGDCEFGRHGMGRKNQAAQCNHGATDHNSPCGCGGDVVDSDRSGRKEQWRTVSNGTEHETAERASWWQSEPDVGRVAHGVAARVDRLRCIGNGQVPAVAALAWKILTK
jgi:DNA (cytosine-5)-methyltransferase 1